MLADQGVVSGANFLAGVILGRLLGPAGYGEFTLIYNAVLFVSGIQMALISTPMMVLGPSQAYDASRNYFRGVVRLQFVFAYAVGIATLLTILLFQNVFPSWRLNGLALPVGLAVSTYLLQDFFRRYAFVRDSAVTALTNDVLAHCSRLALLVGIGIAIGLTATGAFWIHGIASLLGILVAAFMIRESKPVPVASVKEVARVHWRFGKWLLAETIAYWFGGQMLVIYITGHVVSTTAVGAVTAAMNIVGAANILFLALENFVPSRAAARYAAHGKVGLRRYLWRIALLGGTMTLAIVLAATVWAEGWLRLVYGAAYSGYGELILWWGGYYLLGFLQRPFSVGLRVLGNTRAIFVATMAGAAISLVASYPLIRAMNIRGTMLALCIVQFTVLLVMGLLYLSTLRGLRSDSSPDSTVR